MAAVDPSLPFRDHPLTDFSDAELDPDPIVLSGVTWSEAKRTGERLAVDLQRHLNDLRKDG